MSPASIKLRRMACAMGAAFAMSAFAGEGLAEPVLVTSPSPLPLDHNLPRVFMGGSIDMGGAPDWQAAMTRALSDMDVVILNPRRPDWNPAWKPEASEPEFRRQVEWELAALEASDVIVMYFAPSTQSPISLLEMGLHARGGKLIVLAPDGFWRKGNVDITAEAYGVRQVRTMEELTLAVREALAEAATKGRFAR
ncbi:nucleoside 2-deoxyribosyltransferase domain-containing protein [Brevundimonas pishanensis]|uniref:nucleoside 2-deoxyribosyltransferase domain-containing protein n=1 Tax=Brevundimonas pishanensis TaxID=2896315 RepID=UPI001FA6EB41|nr:nucleoside 2-deoxyribosyltransferase domain-containing protein [Brevundimonas pishanensis]